MTSPTLARLRPYRSSDGPFVEELARREFSEYSPRAGAPSRRAATEPGVTAIVAVVADEPVGFAMLTVHEDASARGSVFASLDAIAVDRAHRGQGIGKALLARAEREGKERGARELRLVTAEANVAALDVFLRAGFAIARRLERYYPRGQNAVSMKKSLR